ncbi:hypothetical protein N658DRAFT_2458 [Parathielavia hyrcaniae]|uniref:Uncharacterized protein n=1 Tax=Parathielavia hyrcaniae TaxID=113614 RepID=A0AAN6Q9B8_9PEZI|nr:hypothetical protein N658DRAFT_2458 [Parathielavia hyrcaniae]
MGVVLHFTPRTPTNKVALGRGPSRLVGCWASNRMTSPARLWPCGWLVKGGACEILNTHQQAKLLLAGAVLYLYKHTRGFGPVFGLDLLYAC